MKRVLTNEKKTHIRVFVKDKKILDEIVRKKGLSSVSFALKNILRKK